MRKWLAGISSLRGRFAVGRVAKIGATSTALTFLAAAAAHAQSTQEPGGEANLKVPDLTQVNFLGVNGHTLLLWGILFCIFGLLFGMTMYVRLRNLPVHRSMREMSELIYETCKTYLITQGKFLLLLESFIAVIIILYFGVLLHYDAIEVIIILAVQRRGNLRQLRSCVVRDSRKHIREFADGICGIARASLSRFIAFRCARA